MTILVERACIVYTELLLVVEEHELVVTLLFLMKLLSLTQVVFFLLSMKKKDSILCGYRQYGLSLKMNRASRVGMTGSR